MIQKKIILIIYRDEQGKERTHWVDEAGTTKVPIRTLYEPKHNYLDGQGNLVQRWTKNPNDPPQEGDDFKNSHFSSGRIDSSGVFAPVYGWFEARLDTVRVCLLLRETYE